MFLVVSLTYFQLSFKSLHPGNKHCWIWDVPFFKSQFCFSCEYVVLSYVNIMWFILYDLFMFICVFYSLPNYQVMPENFFVGRRPPFPLWNKKIKIVVGEPIEFDLPKLRQEAVSTSRNLSFPRVGWPSTSPCGLDEAAQRCLFTAVSEQIWAVMERLRDSLKHS